jgi:hypothetical protein
MGQEWDFICFAFSFSFSLLFLNFFNYLSPIFLNRLGALGFLAHPALYTAENGAGVGFYGIQDQRAALQWVQDNIQFFGGYVYPFSFPFFLRP